MIRGKRHRRHAVFRCSRTRSYYHPEVSLLDNLGGAAAVRVRRGLAIDSPLLLLLLLLFPKDERLDFPQHFQTVVVLVLLCGSERAIDTAAIYGCVYGHGHGTTIYQR